MPKRFVTVRHDGVNMLVATSITLNVLRKVKHTFSYFFFIFFIFIPSIINENVVEREKNIWTI